jgi:hypothetical protein
MSLTLSDHSELQREFRPRTGAMEAWNAAYVRVEEYLRAHRVYNRLHATRLTVKILERAAAKHERTPARDPVVLAAEEMEAMTEEWFARNLRDSELPHGSRLVAGRVAMMLANAPERWPYAFLADEVPPELGKVFETTAIYAGPDMSVSSMVPQPIDLGPISDVAGDALHQFERWPLLRTIGLWSLFLAALAAVFHATR